MGLAGVADAGKESVRQGNRLSRVIDYSLTNLGHEERAKFDGVCVCVCLCLRHENTGTPLLCKWGEWGRSVFGKCVCAMVLGGSCQSAKQILAMFSRR